MINQHKTVHIGHFIALFFPTPHSGIAVHVLYTRSGVPSIGDQFFATGTAMLQNLPSIVCARVLQPRAGETVLDMCAAPGNKTTHLVELMGDRGRVVALDKTPHKLRQLEQKMLAFGVRSVRCYAFDATKALRTPDVCRVDSTGVNVVDDTDGDQHRLRPPFAPATFDRILLDGPCSALGNRPQLRNDITLAQLASFPAVQKRLLRAAVDLLRPGGTLVYSTCTLSVDENERMVGWALAKFGDRIELVAAQPLLGGPGWRDCGLSERQRWLVQRFGPMSEEDQRMVRSDDDGDDLCRRNVDVDGCDSVGFFIAKFVRKSGVDGEKCDE